MANITLNGVSIDPLSQAQGLRAASLESSDAADSNYVLIQTDGPVTLEQQQQLADLSVEIQEYVPENAYLCRYAPTDLTPIRALPFVLWANVYMQGFKLAPSLRASEPDGLRALTAAPDTGWPADESREVDVVVHDDVDPHQVAGEVAEAADITPNALAAGRGKVRLSVTEAQLDALTSLDAVHHVEAVPARKLFNNVARPIMHADVTIDGTDYQGEGEVVCVADSGFDTGSTTDVHPAFTGRVANLYGLGGRGNPGDADDPHGHGTHVAGSVLGDGHSDSMGGAIQGTAPRATLVLQSMIDAGGGLGGIPIDLHDLFLPPYRDDDARVHTNSWGAETPGLPYDQSAKEIDDVVWNQPDLAICFAAGNDGIDGDHSGRIDAESIGSQAAAKNCITVGASESQRPSIDLSYVQVSKRAFPADPIASDLMADDADGLGAFSSRGPTQEGRLKPDVVAPGTSILSTLSRAVGHPSTLFGASSDPLFFFDTGTSMATPLVAGCVAVLRETLRRNGTTAPSAALIKALLINGAVELPGQYSPSEAGPSPNNDSGFGRVDLAGSVIIAGEDPNSDFVEGGPLAQGDEDSFTVKIPERSPGDGGEGPGLQSAGHATFKITLVWTDPPGEALQNDLDLILHTANGDERHGNMGVDRGFDRVNNVEQIVWTDIPPGDAKIVVRAARITRFSQPYALAWRIH
jgi:serine protease AprX